MASTDSARTDELFRAIKEGDAAAVEALLEAEPGLLNARSGDGLSPIMVARYYDSEEVAEVLLARGAEVDVFASAALGRTDLIRSFLDADPGLVHAYSADGWTPLHLAAHFGHREAVELLIDAGADVNALSRNAQRNMPLHAALAGPGTDLARLLLDRGADVNARQTHGFTPLYTPVMEGDVATVDLLLRRGADPNVRTDDGKSSLEYALVGGHEAVAERLRAHGAVE